MNRYLFMILFFISITISAQQIDIKKSFIEGKYKLSNNIAPSDYKDDGVSFLLAYRIGRYHGFIDNY